MYSRRSSILNDGCEADLFTANGLLLTPFLDRNFCASLDAAFDHNFKIVALLGKGTYGAVYKLNAVIDSYYTQEMQNPALALKISSRGTHPIILSNELMILKACADQNRNIINLLDSCVINDRLCLMMEYFPNDNFKDFIQIATYDETVEYVLHLMDALRFLHHRAIIHRDVKPSNFLFNRRLKQYRLIDFGLSQAIFQRNGVINADLPLKNNSNNKSESRSAEVFRPSQESCSGQATSQNASLASPELCACFGRAVTCATCRNRPYQKADKAGTSGYRAPEVLLRSEKQGTPLDIWAAGVVLFCFMAKRYPVLKPDNDEDGLTQLALLFGTETLKGFAKNVNKEFVMQPILPGIHLAQFCYMSRGLAPLLAAPNTDCEHCLKYIVFENQNVNYCICRGSEKPPQSLLLSALERMLRVDMGRRWTSDQVITFLEETKEKTRRRTLNRNVD